MEAVDEWTATVPINPSPVLLLGHFPLPGCWLARLVLGKPTTESDFTMRMDKRRTMKARILSVAMAVGWMVGGASAHNYKVTVTDPYGGFTGGPFSAQLKTPAGVAIGSPFLTFCLEKTEYFNPGGTYWMDLNDGAIGGGGENPTEGTTTFDELSYGTAWLYLKFLQGGYANTLSEMENLQRAIWWLEDEISLSTPASNPYIADAMALGVGYDLQNGGGTLGYLPVKVMNLYDHNDGLHQDMLIAVPDGGTTLALFGFGLTGLAALARRRRS
jgi:hypothetical protein